MDPIRTGDRGPAVEDVQRRLLTLGFDLGGTGVDGVFLGRTHECVTAFQRRLGLDEDGVVGPQTWAALVDATFTLGDRLLYLRHPHFHGRDVEALQGALNILGFSSAACDGIFGVFTERAVREFQANCGLVPDGVAGDETVRALMCLRHVWQGKDPAALRALTAAPARRAEVLATSAVAIVASGPASQDLARRLVNLALAAEAASALRMVATPEDATAVEMTLQLIAAGDEAPADVPVARIGPGPEATLAPRLLTALASSKCAPPRVAVDLSGADMADERARQRAAVALLDALCAALA